MLAHHKMYNPKANVPTAAQNAMECDRVFAASSSAGSGYRKLHDSGPSRFSSSGHDWLTGHEAVSSILAVTSDFNLDPVSILHGSPDHSWSVNTTQLFEYRYLLTSSGVVPFSRNRRCRASKGHDFPVVALMLGKEPFGEVEKVI